jgi:hypothetical protein
MWKKFVETLKSQLPPELSRLSSIIAIIIGLVTAGFFLQLGTRLFDGFYFYIQPYTPAFFKSILNLLTYSFTLQVNVLTIALSVVVFFVVYRWIDRLVLNKSKGIVVFEDDFGFSNKGWALNYWGSKNPDKTCHFEDSSLVFEAKKEDLEDKRKEYGAYFDLTSGIYEQTKYEVAIEAKSDKGTNMGIKLWVHDRKGRNDIKFPANFYTPGENYEEMKVGFTGTSSQAMRIHLHIKPGNGKLYVGRVKVIKV